MVATCNDGQKNGNETDVDCGGGTCSKCAVGKVCVQPSDCASGVCSGGKCANPMPLTLGFGNPTMFATQDANTFAAVGELNGDGKPDVVTANQGAGKITSFLGNGVGGLVGVGESAAGMAPQRVVVGDFNGDGNGDVAVTSFNVQMNVGLLTGKGDGTFNAPSLYPDGSNSAFGLAAGDLNGDKKLDLVVTDLGSSVIVMLGKGDGTFQVPVPFATAMGSHGVAIDDFDGDGKSDVAVATGNELDVLLGNGDGTLRPRQVYSTDNQANGIATGDMNGDGKPEVVVANYGGNDVTVLINNGDGSFKPGSNYSINQGQPQTVALADFDKDGKLDVVANDVGQNGVAVWLNTGTGTLKAPVIFPVSNQTQFVAVGDLNKDGKPDLVAGSFLAVYVLLNTSQ